MSTLSVRLEAAKRHGSLWNGFPRPSKQQDAPPPSLLMTAPTIVSPPTRTPSPMFSDTSISSSTFSTGGLVSPLPSPLLGPRRDLEGDSAPVSAGAKTNAFFGSSWKPRVPSLGAGSSPSSPKKLDHQRTTSTSTERSKSPSPTSSSHQHVDIKVNDEDLPSAATIAPASPKSTAAPVEGAGGPSQNGATTPGRSQTLDFFHPASKHSIPSPPPSIRTLSPDDKPEPLSAAALRLQLARLSPPRKPVHPPGFVQLPNSTTLGTGVTPQEEGAADPGASHSRSRSSSHSSAHGGAGAGFPSSLLFSRPSYHQGYQYHQQPRERDFAYWTPESSDLSRSSSRSSVSGVRRDFASSFTPINPSSSYSPSNHSSSPLARFRKSLDETPMPSSPLELQTPRPNDYVPTPTQETTNGALIQGVRRETQRNPSQEGLQTGMIIGDEAPLVLVRLLGQGAFSSVWLARDIEDRLIPPGPRQRRRKSVSTARKQGDVEVPGLKPAAQQASATRLGVLNELDGEGAILPPSTTPPGGSVNGSVGNGVDAEARSRPVVKIPTPIPVPGGSEARPVRGSLGKLVAVKMLDRTLCDVNDRTRISFVREVEVLRHISHPSIVAFLHAFTISGYHCVVLEHIGGGELFELINSDDNHAKVTTPLLRRMWGELCRAVGWLHGVAIVHRDIKLENILLTVNPFLNSPLDLAALPQPLVKLTDFGLARFIDPNDPLLTTRCGSESYAAPEIVMGSAYDGRRTDSWACGVVLYALAMRRLPFDSPKSAQGKPVTESRRQYLVRIAKAEYSWLLPEPKAEPDDGDGDGGGGGDQDDSENSLERKPTGHGLITDDLKAVVARLIVRNPEKRASIAALWEDESPEVESFMYGEGAVSPPWRVAAKRAAALAAAANADAADAASGPQSADSSCAMEEDEEEDGMLVDAHDIDSIASQELV